MCRRYCVDILIYYLRAKDLLFFLQSNIKMAPALGAAEAEWLAQLATMRKAIQDLKLDQQKFDLDQYERENGITDDDFEEGEIDDIWDISDDAEDDEYSSDSLEQPDGVATNGIKPSRFDKEWLQTKCMDFASRKPGLDASELEQHVMALLASDSQDDELQMSLAEIVGYDDLDFVIDLISHRQEILSSPADNGIQKANREGLLGRLHTKQERETALRRQDWEHKNAGLAPAASRGEPNYPHVYRAHKANNLLAPGGQKYSLPVGSERKEHDKYEEYSIPATKTGVLGKGQKLVEVADMDGLCRQTFTGYKSLNRMQSLVYPVAYTTSENMLICAPTGAGKTDAAMLTILNAISHNISPNPHEQHEANQFLVNREDFKIVYVAPMKALAAEVTEKLGKRLAWLGITAREFTGDMHLTKKEIVQTQIIVTTPEKWDVVTRKSTGDTELVQKVRLLIIDEVHMLHDERGAVLESLVARTQRQVESTQSLIRIVGLSATLPNYADVADFLKVNRYAGMFYFDASFRPVPLQQHFCGVRAKAGSKQSKDTLDLVAFEKVKDMLKEGHQVMVFVHSRKDTVLTARTLISMAQDQACEELFDCSGVDGFSAAMKDLKTAKGREVKELVPKGFGTHHAGMPRTDRNKIETLFAKGHISVLCCTATLAWGVNLPAAAVIIKGTQLYSAEAGKFVDLGILDVLQIFGRAGRPQFESTGIGYILTTQDKLQHYLSAVTQQHDIESNFSKKLVDNLNAEVSLGTVTSVQDAVQWLGYSYLFVRMKRNPFAYGIDYAELHEDPQLVQRMRKLIVEAATTLEAAQMIIFNRTTEELKAKDVGRIASQYYVLHSSIEMIDKEMKPLSDEEDIFRMLSMSNEFNQIQARESEAKELKHLNDNFTECEVKGGSSSPAGKTNVLLQAYISRAKIEDFALVSDTNYVAQNAARICRALFMIALNRRWGYQCLHLLSLCKAIEKRIWPDMHPFHQFDLPIPILSNLDKKGTTAQVESLRDMEAAELGQLVHNHGMGKTLSKLLDNFPTLTIEAEIAPLNRDVLRIHLYITPDFLWSDRHHGTSEAYWIWVENSETSEIYHHEYFILGRKKLFDDHEMHFTIPLSDPLPNQIYVRAVSDRWLGADTVTAVSFQHLIRPDTESVYTDLLNLQPLPITALKNPLLEEIYGQRFQFFNPMQTQIFHTLYHTSENVLLGSPTGSGKTIAAELAMWWAFRENPGSKVVYIAPMKALVRERVQDWRKRLTQPMGLKLVELTGDNTPDTRTIRDADIIVTTPEKWDGISRSWQTRGYVRQVSLVIIDEIHLLGGDRGPILEIIVSRMNYIASQSKGAVRLVGMSTACANAMDLANWLGVKRGLFNFRHSVRPVPLQIYIDGFPEQRGFCPLMQSMNRPTFLAIKQHSPEKPVIVFVASRRQTRLTAKDLINFCGMEDNPRRFVRMSEEDLQYVLSTVKDEALKEALSFGIGLHHAGLVESDRQLAEELFANNKIQILVATSTLAWGVNLPAHLVVVKGTQFFDAKIAGYKDMDLTDVLQMLGRAGRPQFDTSGIARIFTQDAKKDFYKHFLHTGFPVESSLHNVLDNHLGAEVSAGTIVTKQDALDYLTWTFFFRRLHKNPSYYGLEISAEEHNSISAQTLANDYMISLVDKSLDALASSSCITLHSNGDVDSTALGKIMSYYYLSHLTIRHLVSHAKRDASFTDVLAWMCAATEFDDLPVRHNEDLINAELAKNLPLDISAMGSLPMWDPHVKAFLLLQAYMSRIDLPISDYVGDQNSVLDQSIRIIQASIDVLTELGFFSSCKTMIALLQCIKSARWPKDNPFSILPGIEPETPLPSSSGTPKDLVSLASTPNNAATGTKILTALGVPSSQQRQAQRAASFLPALKITVQPSSPPLTASLVISRTNIHPSPNDFHIYAPRYPKAQSEGFFVLAVDPERDEVAALKRVGWNAGAPGKNKGAALAGSGSDGGGGGGTGTGSVGRGAVGAGSSSNSRAKPTARTTLKVSQEGWDEMARKEGKVFDVWAVSDAYIGMERVIRGVEVKPMPETVSVEGVVGKEKGGQ